MGAVPGRRGGQPTPGRVPAPRVCLHTGAVAIRRRLRSGTTLLLAVGAVLVGSGTAVVVGPEPRVAAEVGSVLAAPGPTMSGGSAAELRAPRIPSASAPEPADFVPRRL